MTCLYNFNSWPITFTNGDWPAKWTYILQADNDYIKIGKSKDPEKRYKQLNNGSPIDLHKIALFDHELISESRLHSVFYELEYKGEWFTPEFELLEFIDFLVERVDK